MSKNKRKINRLKPKSENDLRYEKNMETYLRWKEKDIDKAVDRRDYAVKQFDTLMVALSTAGLGFTLNYMKGLTSIRSNIWFANASQILFMSCLLLILFAHIVSMWANGIGIRKDYLEYEMDAYGTDKVQGFDEKNYHKKLKQYSRLRFLFNWMVRIFNICAFCALISAILSFVYFTF